MTREEQLDRMLQYLSERKETGGVREFCERELGMNAEAYRELVGQLLRDGMAEWQDPPPGQLAITAEGRFLLIGGGYGLLVLSWDYQKKQRREARQEIVKAILNRSRAALRWGKFGTVVGERLGTLGRNKLGAFTRGRREATGRPVNRAAPDRNRTNFPSRSEPKASLRGWFNETNLLRLTAVAVFTSVLILVLLLAI